MAWSANASYVLQPQQENSSLSLGQPSPVSTVRSSNYITLSDVCDYREQILLTDGKPGPTSPIPPDSSDDVTTPTIFFDLGASASIQGIGSNTLTFSLNAGVNHQVVSVGS